MSTLTLVLFALFGSPEAAIVARAHHGIETMCPCSPADAASPATHRLAAHVFAAVALADPDPDDALAVELGTAAHETCLRHTRQLGGGPAVSWHQLEGPAADLARWLADPVIAATRALWVARSDHGKLVAYSGGSERVAADLRRFIDRARWATR